MTHPDPSEARPWREILTELDAEGERAVSAWLSHIGDPSTGAINGKTRELIWVATSTAVRAEASLRAHVGRALTEGASHSEVYQAMALGSASGGIPALTLGLTVLDSMIPKGQQ